MILILGQREKTVLFENPYYRRTDLVLNFVKLGVDFQPLYSEIRNDRVSPIIGSQRRMS